MAAMMDQARQVNAPPKMPDAPRRPARLMSHSHTAAMLCLLALCVDAHVRPDWRATGQVALIEMALAIYGTTFAMISFVRGGLRRLDKGVLFLCLSVFVITAATALLMPRLIVN